MWLRPENLESVVGYCLVISVTKNRLPSDVLKIKEMCIILPSILFFLVLDALLLGFVQFNLASLGL